MFCELCACEHFFLDKNNGLAMGNGHTSVTRIGHHGHPKPIVKRPALASIEHLKRVVSINPEAGPAKLQVGFPESLPMPDISIASANKGQLSHLQMGILGRTSSMDGKGIRNSTGASSKRVLCLKGANSPILFTLFSVCFVLIGKVSS